jgi:hypothetical protein
LTYSGNLKLYQEQNVRMTGITLNFQNLGAGLILDDATFNQFSFLTIKECGNATTPCLLLETDGTTYTTNTAYNTFDHLRIQCNESANQHATGIELKGSGAVNAGSIVTQNRFNDVVISGSILYGIQQELNADTNYFHDVSVNELITLSGSSIIAINTLSPGTDQDADAMIYDGINGTGPFGAHITAGSTTGSHIRFSFGGAPVITSLGGTQSWTLEGVGLFGSASSISVPTLTITKGITSSGPGVQHKRFSGCTTNNGVGWACSVTVTWAQPFPDANYSVVCSVNASSSYFGYAMPANKTATATLTNLVNGTPGQVFSPSEVDCVAVHD